jgi:hypothetical protein
MQCQHASKMVPSTTSPARSDARVQHVGVQFGKNSGKHLHDDLKDLCQAVIWTEEKYSFDHGYCRANIAV